MHEPAPILPDPESERRGHELRDVALRPILMFLIGLFIFGGVVQASMSLLMTGYASQDTKVAVPEGGINLLHDQGNLDRPAPLQRDTTRDMLDMYKADESVLYTSQGQFNKESGKYSIPIRRSMDVVIKKGLLKHRDAPAKSAIDPEPLPYPKHSETYKATR